MVLALIVNTLVKVSLPADVLTVIVLFFAAGMTGLAITGLQQADYGLKEDEPRLSTRRYWLVSVASVIAVLLVLGLIVSALIEPEMVARALRWTSVLLDIIGRVLYYVIFLFVEPLIKWLRSLRSEGEAESQLELPDFQKQLEELTKEGPSRTTAIWGEFRWIGLAVVIILIGLIFAWALRRFTQGKDDDVEETRRTILSRSLLQEQLSALWREWLNRFRRTTETLVSPFLSLDGEVPTRRLVRQIYQSLLATAAEHQHPRARGQTPTDYQRVLEAALPFQASELDAITKGYLRARYAPEPPTAEEAERARGAWDSVRRAFEETDRDEIV